jgi:hypothetical protein
VGHLGDGLVSGPVVAVLVVVGSLASALVIELAVERIHWRPRQPRWPHAGVRKP